MLEMVKAGPVGELPPGASKVYTVGDREIAVFNIGGTLYAIDDRCPHSGASLGLGTVAGSVVTCPWHAWEFDLASGECVGRTAASLRRFPVTIEGEDVLLDVSPTADEQAESEAEPVYSYLIRYGAMAWVARFGSAEWIACSHGDRVVIKTLRGMEIGEVLAAPRTSAEPPVKEPQSGDLLRVATPAEEARHQKACVQTQVLLEECQKHVQERQIAAEVIDCEPLFDQETIVVYYLGQPSRDLEKLAADLSEARATHVLFHPVIEPVAEPGHGGCGSGSGGGGCGSGGCGN